MLGLPIKSVLDIVRSIEMGSKAFSGSGWLPVQDAVGIDIKLLDAVQSKIVSIYAGLQEPYNPSALGTFNDVFPKSVQDCMYKATGCLLDDLYRNCRLLGTPERSSTHPSLLQPQQIG